MTIWQGLGSRIRDAIQANTQRKRLTTSGPIRDFYRGGGNTQLYADLHLCQDDLVIDAGDTKANGPHALLADPVSPTTARLASAHGL